MKDFTIANILQRAIRAHALNQQADNVVEAVWRAAGVYGAAPTCHLSLLARTKGYTAADLDEAVMQTRTLVRVPAMRGSIYLLPPALVPHALALTRLPSVETYTRMDIGSYATLTDRIEQIAAEKPGTGNEIRAALGEKAPKGEILRVVLRRMTHEGRIVRTRVRGGMSSQSYEYARMADWVNLPAERPSRAEALQTLAHPWLLANGPATAADLGWWAGVPLREAKEALVAIQARPIRVKGVEEPLLAMDELLDDLANPLDNDDEIHPLPVWDSYLMAHRDRSRYLNEAHRPYVVDRSGNVANVLLRAGRVVGIWDLDGQTFLYAAFESLPQSTLEAVARRLLPLYEINKIQEVIEPRPLDEGGQNAFRAPLRRV